MTISGPSDGELWGNDLGNGTFTGLTGDVQNDRTDIAFADLYLLPKRSKIVDFTYPHFFDSVCFMVSKPSPMPKFLSVIIPLDSITWLLFGITLILALLIGYVFCFVHNESRIKAYDMILRVVFEHSSKYVAKFKR